MLTLNRVVKYTLNSEVGDLYKLEGPFPIGRIQLLFEEKRFRSVASDSTNAESFLNEQLNN